MQSVLEKIFSKSKTPTSESLRHELTKAEAAVETATADINAAREDYQRSLLNADPSATGEAKKTVTAAELTLDRAEALVGALRARMHEACEREAEDDRRATYQAAKRVQTKAVERLHQYREHASAIAEIVEQLARAELLVRDANKDLPQGTDPIALRMAVQ